jgi:hypothetical protein
MPGVPPGLDETLTVVGGVPDRSDFGVDDVRWSGWEMAFFAGALAAQMDRCDADYQRLVAGPAMSAPAAPDAKPLDLDALTKEMGELTTRVETILAPERVAHVFGPDRPVGDVQPMLDIASELGKCYEGLVAYAIALRCGATPAFRVELLQAFADLVTLPIEQFRAFVATFNAAALSQTQALRSGVEQPRGVNLTLELSVDPAAKQRLDEVSARLQQHHREKGAREVHHGQR